MSRYHSGWAPYVPVAERRRKAERVMAKLRKAGHPVAPVTVAGRAIATTVWGRAWCDNLEAYRDYETRLPRGRSYVRNGSVVDLQIAPGRVTAMVSGSDLYDVAITIKGTATASWGAMRAACAGGIGSLIELLQGRLSNAVMQRLCRQDGGLFPRPSEIRFSCSCLDHASMCKHVAAVLYGVGARLDQAPELLFRLRAVEAADLVAGIDTAPLLAGVGPTSGKVLQTDDMSALFGLDIMAADLPTSRKAPKTARAAQARQQAPTPVAASPEKVKSAAHARAVARPAPSGGTGRRQRTITTAEGRTGRKAPADRAQPTRSSRRLNAGPTIVPEAPKAPPQDRVNKPVTPRKIPALREPKPKPKPKPVKWW